MYACTNLVKIGMHRCHWCTVCTFHPVHPQICFQESEEVPGTTNIFFWCRRRGTLEGAANRGKVPDCWPVNIPHPFLQALIVSFLLNEVNVTFSLCLEIWYPLFHLLLFSFSSRSRHDAVFVCRDFVGDERGFFGHSGSLIFDTLLNRLASMSIVSVMSLWPFL